MKTSHPVHRIALTPGEPAGIGPDLCIQLSQEEQTCELIIIADPGFLADRASKLGLNVSINIFDAKKMPKINNAYCINVLPVSLLKNVSCGQLNADNSPYVVETIKRATLGSLEGSFDAMVTAPVHKGIINKGGTPFTGHTEFIADITGGYPVMMLATSGLRVALATTHLPISEVSKAITVERLTKVIKILNKDLRTQFSLSDPKILVCGLNPHAGENGHLGQEEIEIIEPVLNKLRNQGMNLHGPLPADTAFTPKYLSSADAVLAMYHDQGLPVLKHMGFGQAVNITLGLPIIRTSVDHGTALDLAGTGNANIGSLKYAIKTAQKMIESKRNT